MFVTFEGGEGAGKSTLIAQLAKKFSALVVREPGGTPLGEKLRTLLLEREGPVAPQAELAMFLASRAQHVMAVIKPALEEGKVVLCDRFNDSSVAYQGHARGLGMEKVREFCAFASQGVEPDLTIYLDIEPEVGLKRAGRVREKDRIEAEKISFHHKIREGFLLIAKKEPERVFVIDAEKSPEEVFQLAMEKILACLKTS